MLKIIDAKHFLCKTMEKEPVTLSHKDRQPCLNHGSPKEDWILDFGPTKVENAYCNKIRSVHPWVQMETCACRQLRHSAMMRTGQTWIHTDLWPPKSNQFILELKLTSVAILKKCPLGILEIIFTRNWLTDRQTYNQKQQSLQPWLRSKNACIYKTNTDKWIFCYSSVCVTWWTGMWFRHCGLISFWALGQSHNEVLLPTHVHKHTNPDDLIAGRQHANRLAPQ